MQTVDKSTGSFRRRRRSSQSGSSVSTRDSLVSQDIGVLHQFEEEEIESRRHRINRINARKMKKCMPNRLLDVFGIEEENGTTSQTDMQLNENSNDDVLSSSLHDKLSDSFKSLFSDHNDSFHSQISPKEDEKDIVVEGEIKEPAAAVKQSMTEEEMYIHHLQAYLNDNMDEVVGDLEYCDDHDLEFLFNDPDETEANPVWGDLEQSDKCFQNDSGKLLIFEIYITHCDESSRHFDDCSEITL
jgi:hypothetical protein